MRIAGWLKMKKTPEIDMVFIALPLQGITLNRTAVLLWLKLVTFNGDTLHGLRSTCSENTTLMISALRKHTALNHHGAPALFEYKELMCSSAQLSTNVPCLCLRIMVILGVMTSFVTLQLLISGKPEIQESRIQFILVFQDVWMLCSQIVSVILLHQAR